MRHSLQDDELENIYWIAVVIPVYRGEATLEPLVKEIEPLTKIQKTPGGNLFRVTEIVLVHDGAVNNSDEVMQRLASRSRPQHSLCMPVPPMNRRYDRFPARCL